MSVKWGSSVLAALIAGAIAPAWGSPNQQEPLCRGVVRILDRNGATAGAGFVVGITDSDVLVVTALHVVEGRDPYRVQFFGMRAPAVLATVERPSTALDLDNVTQFALLEVPRDEQVERARAAKRIVSLPQSLRVVSEIPNGTPVLLIGQPPTKPWDCLASTIKTRRFQEIDVARSVDGRGFSGGPVLLDGRWVGLIEHEGSDEKAEEFGAADASAVEGFVDSYDHEYSRDLSNPPLLPLRVCISAQAAVPIPDIILNRLRGQKWIQMVKHPGDPSDVRFARVTDAEVDAGRVSRAVRAERETEATQWALVRSSNGDILVALDGSSGAIDHLAETLEKERLYRSALRLSSANSVNLEKAQLSGVNLRGERLRGANLHRANLAGTELVGADLQGADLVGANLQGGATNLTRAHLEGANLQNAYLQQALLAGAFMSGATFGLRGVPGSANLDTANLSHTHLHEAKLWSVNLHVARLEGADLSDADLGMANLAEADLEGADLTRAKLEGANLRYTHLKGAILEGVILKDSYHRHAVYNDRTEWPAGFDPVAQGAYRLAPAADLRKADLSDTSLSDVDNLSGADLEEAKLIGTHLSGVNLSGVHLEKADLTNAVLMNVNLTGAKLTDTKLGGARYDGLTKWPSGFDPLEHGAIPMP